LLRLELVEKIWDPRWPIRAVPVFFWRIFFSFVFGRSLTLTGCTLWSSDNFDLLYSVTNCVILMVVFLSS
jgi:hypothetical protein